MANEINYTLNLSYTKNGRSFTLRPGSRTLTQAGDAFVSGVITTDSDSIITVPLGDVGTDGGIAIFENLDATNRVELGYDDTGFVAVMSIPPGQAVLVFLNGLLAAPQLKAYTLVPETPSAPLVSYSILAE